MNITRTIHHTARARAGVPLALGRQHPKAAYQQTDLAALANYLILLMLRNVTSDGYIIEDPANPGQYSAPGCVVAAPSFPANTPGVDQDYVYNWVRDAAITAIEIAAAGLPLAPGSGMPSLIDYASFARLCQTNAHPTLGHACFTVAGQPRPWTEQNDGPAIQSLALLQAYPQLDTATQATARQVIETNVSYLLGVYQQPTTNLWEEHEGLSFFARSVQLRCLREVAANSYGIGVTADIKTAIAWLESALQDHWNGSYYVTMLAPGAGPGVSVVPEELGYDPNIDIVSACVYGAVPATDTKLLATAARLRSQWADPNSSAFYPINAGDQTRGIGPLLGRYPGDTYDGDVAHPVAGGHPWALCTCNFAELYYRLANDIDHAGTVPLDSLSQDFFAQVGVTSTTSASDTATALRSAGDAMLRAVIYHSDRYELSEQFDGTSGYEKSVHNLTWSYASFLSAVRVRTSGNKLSGKVAGKSARAAGSRK
ncbi:glycoside hydrolase family 15 protein (plasmid) [Rhizobium sp. CB3090]|uniref:glycoside hydrolase family 15 protein n=1 Tax=Rhizobium sp. CB3090 TaxID=3039156 RepID=UPI0024B1669A|nr:glycoside hydrolase family 15 protein [Rhizobium sp. CB3090]WFU12035.1 glycoside hydrolase family 15 protein [Rhizobium sp. CB3090]